MLRLPCQIDIGPYTLHLDVLTARLERKRRGGIRAKLLLVTLFVIVAGATLSLSQLQSRGTVVIPDHSASLTISLNGHALTEQVVQVASGQHTLRFEQAGSFPVEQAIEVTRAQTITVALPLLRPIPTVQRLPLAEAQSAWTSVSTDAAGGWRLALARANDESTTSTRPGWGTQNDAAVVSKVLHLDNEGITPLSVLQTYPVADELVTLDGSRYWAMWEKGTTLNSTGVAGILSVTTPKGTHTVSTTATLRGLWWSPDGRMLLAAVSRGQGVDLALLDPQHLQHNLTSLIAMWGMVQTVTWHSDAQAVVVITAPEPPAQDTQSAPARPTLTPQDEGATDPITVSRDAVLLRLAHDSISTQVTRLHTPPSRPAGVVPFAWTNDALWWVADTGLGLALERISLADTSVQRIGALESDVAAFSVLMMEQSGRFGQGKTASLLSNAGRNKRRCLRCPR